MHINPKNIYLLNRLTFGPKLEWLETDPKLLHDFDYLLNWIFTTIPEFLPANEYLPQFSRAPKNDKWRNNWPHQTQISDWISSMVELENPLREKIALFWHLHIPVGMANPNYQFAQHLLLDAYRKNGTTDFYSLLTEVADSPCTMRFLNAYYSHKRAPNQNFPRELLEIFTMGDGNYTQSDIEEFSRCFTGRRTIDPGVNKTPYPHRPFIDESTYDDGIKTFFNETGNFDSYDAYKIVLKQHQTANYIALRILKYFYKEFPEEKHTDQVSKILRDNNFNTIKTLRFIVEQDWFYENINEVKNPIDLWVNIQRISGMRPLTTKTNFETINEMGLNPFYPKNVKGWPWGEEWLFNNLTSKRIFIPLVYLEISKPFNSQISASIDKIWKPYLRLYRYNHKIQFSETETIKQYRLNWSQWSNNLGNSLKDVISNPKFQYWRS